ncbi:phosphate ABC transporter membrane protein 1, PhoT family [Ferrimonas sediminum]|uniref:Phosphate ABC transporter membrane protein 1, PhoT family n=1 Tax=Ferrimonas sediminum TaxID=718193 RepID=A0A1G9B136_9GAMM|nr:ABC transporter permease subunit [Ferrimonas sediminum]SDK32545.1 phosphate ABC transporter membrane protein 1, PhoT family [Ferrimonas sediminum]
MMSHRPYPRLTSSMATLVLLLIAALFVAIGWFALPVFLHSSQTLLTFQWQPELGCYGILPMVAGSALVALMALMLACPLALGLTAFGLLVRRPWLATLVRTVVRLMAGVPTVVYGIAALFLLVPLLRESFRAGSGYSLLAAALMLSLLILPVMVSMLDSQMRPLMLQLRIGARSMGFTDAQTLTYLVLPRCRRAMISAALLGFGRAVGDTLLPMMLAGNAPQLTGSVLDSIRTLTAHIGLVVATEQGSAMYNSLFASGLILLGLSAVLTLTTRALLKGGQP